jgi:hypothetical protein
MLFAARIWHWWIGVVFTVAAVLTVAGLVVGYLKNVTAGQYRARQNARQKR